MRNLKKFLALVLAMMMAMSLMITANAANEADNATKVYPDGDSVTPAFVTAVDVLSGMGVFKGRDTGNFDAGATITRAETAAIIYRLITADVNDVQADLYRNVAHPFVDVKPGDWYAGYIGFLWNAGIIKGQTATTFNPYGKVTGYEALAMILRAVGYDQNHEFEGQNWVINVASISQRKGILTDVESANYGGPYLYAAARRDVVASLLFRTAAYVPQVIYTTAFQYTETGMTGGPVGTVTNPTLGMQNFGLTNHTGIIVGNQATGESYTKIGFAVNPTISKGLLVGDDLATGTSPIINGTLVAAEITDVVDDNAYFYATDKATAENITLAFDWNTNLSLFNHKVEVWYDCRGTNGATETVGVSGTNYVTSTVAFGTNNKTYALYDRATAKVDTAANWALTGADGDLNKVFSIRDNAFYNYAFAPMTAANKATGAGNAQTLPAVSAKSPIMANNDKNDLGVDVTLTHPLYIAIDNTGDGAAEVIISLDLTISKVVQDNDTQSPKTTGILTQNGTGTGYFDLFDQVNPAIGDDYSNILNDKMVDSDDVALRDYVAAVTVTGTTAPQNNGISDATAAAGGAAAGDATDGNAGTTNNFNSTFYYKVDKLTKKYTKTVWKYDIKTQEVFFSDGTSYKRSIYALAVDGSFKERQYVQAPVNYGEQYTFWLDEEGNYLFWEVPAVSAEFVYGTYIDWETKTATGSFDYPMVYVNYKGEDQQVKNITKVGGNAMDIWEYEIITLPKRNNKTGVITGSDSGFVKGTYIGYAMNDAGELTPVTDTADQATGFWQADTDNFGTVGRSTVINGDGVAIGAVPVANANVGGSPDATKNTDNLFLTETTKFVVVDGAGTATQKATVYEGITKFLDDYASVEIDAVTPIAATATYLSGDAAGSVPATTPYQMVYYSLADVTYDQTYDPSAKVIGTVFIPAEMVKTTPKAVSGNLYFVGDATYSIINANDNATLFTMYKDGVKGDYWIKGQANQAASATNDAEVVKTLGNNVFYLLVETGNNAWDGQPIYELKAMTQSEANNAIIGKYYGDDGTNTGNERNTAGQTTRDGASPNKGYLAATRNSQVAEIGGRGGQDLFNVASANVTNLNGGYTIDSLEDLNGQSSLTSNQGVNVSCVLASSKTVERVYVNF